MTASKNVSLHARPPGSDMPERPGSSYISAATLQNLANFSEESQEWHVIGSDGVTARETEELDSACVRVLPFACLLTVTDKIGHCLKVSSPVVGWVPVADNTGYVLLAKGGLDAGVKWRYRVVFKEGAFVRPGVELTSLYLFSLPCHSVVEVFERRINEIGVPRLKIAEGWISEILNPLSGQSGPLMEIVPLLRPLLYRVVSPDGVVVGSTVELASAHVKTVAAGEVVEVCAKQFSDLGNRCVQRLKLSDGSGWLSMRLNEEPPLDAPMVEFVGVAELSTPVTDILPSAQPRDGSGVGKDVAVWEKGVKGCPVAAAREETGEMVLGEEAVEGEAKNEEAEESEGRSEGLHAFRRFFKQFVVCFSGERGVA